MDTKKWSVDISGQFDAIVYTRAVEPLGRPHTGHLVRSRETYPCDLGRPA